MWKPCSPPFHRSPVNVLVTPLMPSITQTVDPDLVTLVKQTLSRSENTSVSSDASYSMLLRWQAPVPPCAFCALTTVVALELAVPLAGKILTSSQPFEPDA